MDAENPFTIQEVRLFRPSHLSPRISGQLGYFTVHPHPFRDLAESNEINAQLVKFTIRGRARPSLRNALDRLGINASSLFPGLDGIARHIRSTWTRAEDEVVTA